MQQLSGASLCLIEDDAIMGESLVDRFILEGFTVDWLQRAGDASAAFLKKNYDIVISDLRLPDGSGEEVFSRLVKEQTYTPPFVFITAFGSIETAVKLLQMGASDYITKPFDLDQLVEKVRALCAFRNPCVRDFQRESVLGISSVMQSLEAKLSRIAQHGANALIIGESGVGKECMAMALHATRHGPEQLPFIAVNCAAITETLLESELFGYERGAFTGANRTKPGIFERANGGTLFLDEIGDMSLTMQAKLLRVIQDKRVTRVGGETVIPVEFHLICATNRDLKELVTKGLFREDLFYRVNVVQLHIPRLAERPEDILWFAHIFLENLAERFPPERKSLSVSAQQALIGYGWPGNVRELKHVLERAWIFSDRSILRALDLFPQDTTHGLEGDDFERLEGYLAACERAHIIRALEKNSAHIGEAAASLGISRKNLWEKMKKLSIAAKN